MRNKLFLIIWRLALILRCCDVLSVKFGRHSMCVRAVLFVSVC